MLENLTEAAVFELKQPGSFVCPLISTKRFHPQKFGVEHGIAMFLQDFWVAVKEVNLSYYIGKRLVFAKSTYIYIYIYIYTHPFW